MIKKRNLNEGFSSFNDHWSPKIAGSINDMHLKLVKVKGDFHWHFHEHEDELFLVMKGILQMKIRNESQEEYVETVGTGEFIIIPKGVYHCPFAEEECEIILLEPKGTLNTGNITTEKTVSDLNKVSAYDDMVANSL